MNLKDVTALILVGGLGTRLKAVIGEDTPKPLALISGEPFLKHLLLWLSKQGVKNVVLATGHLAESFEDTIAGYCPIGMSVSFSRETEPLGTGGAIKNALPHLNSDPILVMNGDSVASVSLAELISNHGDGYASMALIEVPDAARFGTVDVDRDGLVSSYREKKGLPNPGYINAGFYLLSQNFLADLPNGRFSLEQDIFPNVIPKGIKTVSFEGDFIDIGTPESYASAADFFSRFA
jgi:D-glycero-alpha-D-manno-heptose 1-phosphate guanylyltransferase